MADPNPLTAAALRRALSTADDEPVGVLHRANHALWACEDEVRRRDLPDAEVVRLKREIDRLNLARHAAIHALDAWLDDLFPVHAGADDPDVVLNSESIGQMLDRLSIVELKRVAWVGTEKHAALDHRASLLERCIDRVLDGLRAGLALPQRYDESKTYSA